MSEVDEELTRAARQCSMTAGADEVTSKVNTSKEKHIFLFTKEIELLQSIWHFTSYGGIKI